MHEVEGSCHTQRFTYLLPEFQTFFNAPPHVPQKVHHHQLGYVSLLNQHAPELFTVLGVSVGSGTQGLLGSQGRVRVRPQRHSKNGNVPAMKVLQLRTLHRTHLQAEQDCP